MVISFKEELSRDIKKMLMDGGTMALVSPYISDFKAWGNTRGSKLSQKGSYLVELLISQTLEEDARILIITDEDSKNRRYSKDIIKEIQNKSRAFWIYLFEIKNLHAKLFLTSNNAIVGSSNLTFPALRKNIELGKETDNKQDIIKLKNFVGELIISSSPLNKSSKEFKKNLLKQSLFKKELIFDVLELISKSQYYFRTSRLEAYHLSKKIPKQVFHLGRILSKFEIEEEKLDWARLKRKWAGEKILVNPLKLMHVKKNGKKRGFFWGTTQSIKTIILIRKRKEGLNIKFKKINEINAIWKKYLSGQIKYTQNKFKLKRRIHFWGFISRVFTGVKPLSISSEFLAKILEERFEENQNP